MKTIRITALLLALCLLCSACSVKHKHGDADASDNPSKTEAQPTATHAAPTEPTETDAPLPPGLLRDQSAGSRDYLPSETITMPLFEDMEYIRPDTEEICNAFDTLTSHIESSPTEDILSEFFTVYDQYYHFYTMDTLANIRYYADMTDSFYKSEYEFCEQASPDIEEKLEAFLKACAESDKKTALEEQYFGENALDQYIDYAVYTNPDYLALAKKEKSVMEDYHKAMENPQITFEGKTQSFDELVDRYADNSTKYVAVLEAYYDKYNPIIGEYFIELIKVRRQMAKVLDYDSYADYCCEETYSRDYNWADAKAYIAQIRNAIVPLYSTLEYSGLLYSLQPASASEKKVFKAFSGIIPQLGDTIGDAFDFMTTYRLFDISQDANKMETSFTTYLFDYEAPYLLVNSQGTMDDLFTFAHEFGHFTDNFATYNGEEDLETAETFSQGMEWLALCYSDDVLNKREREIARLQKLADTVTVFISQAAYSDFEDRVYALSDSELTVDRLNSIYRQITKDYGFYSPYADFYYSMAWIDIPHFFEAPFYMISYCVSADTALQIYQRELESKGSGLELYYKLLDRTPGDGIQAVCEAAGMENPFSEGRLKEIAAFLKEELGLR